MHLTDCVGGGREILGTPKGNRKIAHFFRKYSAHLIGHFFQKTHAFLENPIPLVPTEKTFIHFVQWNILEAEQTGGVVISNNNAVHITYSGLEAGSILSIYIRRVFIMNVGTCILRRQTA